jgi:ribosome-binding factor A
MTSRRTLKAAEAIREVVSMAILTELRDPRIANVTVTRAEISPDMRHAKIHVSVMGDEQAENLTLKGLRSASGFLQKKVAQRIETRYTPKLTFVLDRGVKHALEVNRILNEVLPAEESTEDVSASDADEDADSEIGG